MRIKEVAQLIAAIADSLERNPDQFIFRVSVVGTRVSVSGPGTGLIVTAEGGGPGSSTVGFQSSASTGDIDVARDMGRRAVSQEMSEVIGLFRELSEAATTNDTSRRTGLVHRLRQSAVVPMMAVELATFCMDLAKLPY